MTVFDSENFLLCRLVFFVNKVPYFHICLRLNCFPFLYSLFQMYAQICIIIDIYLSTCQSNDPVCLLHTSPRSLCFSYHSYCCPPFPLFSLFPFSSLLSYPLSLSLSLVLTLFRFYRYSYGNFTIVFYMVIVITSLSSSSPSFRPPPVTDEKITISFIQLLFLSIHTTTILFIIKWNVIVKILLSTCLSVWPKFVSVNNN